MMRRFWFSVLAAVTGSLVEPSAAYAQEAFAAGWYIVQPQAEFAVVQLAGSEVTGDSFCGADRTTYYKDGLGSKGHPPQPITRNRVVLCPSSLTSQAPFFGVDGETWVQIDTTDFGRLQKLILLRGIYDGLLFGRSPEINLHPQNVGWNTLIAGLDQLYSDFANRKILVVWALQILRVEITGENQVAVDSVTAYNRCRATSLNLALTTAEWRSRNGECAQSAGRRH